MAPSHACNSNCCGTPKARLAKLVVPKEVELALAEADGDACAEDEASEAAAASFL